MGVGPVLSSPGLPHNPKRCEAAAFVQPARHRGIGGDMTQRTDEQDVRALGATLEAAERGEIAATAELFSTLYRELHRLARRQLHVNASGLTLGATTLLHEAYLDLSRRGLAFPDRPRFFAYAARAMRGLIIDYVREHRAIKRGGQFHLTTLDTVISESVPQLDELGPLGHALDELAAAEPALAELVELKFFCGFDFAEIAAMRGVSERTVQRDWAKARLFLRSTLREED
jgi:RNA polymerase sigma factor (TIGR02999 family)